jgi:hypothetical protein
MADLLPNSQHVLKEALTSLAPGRVFLGRQNFRRGLSQTGIRP